MSTNSSSPVTSSKQTVKPPSDLVSNVDRIVQIRRVLELHVDNADIQTIAEVVLDQLHLMLCKNIDYGGTIFKTGRLTPNVAVSTMILRRLEDKWDRLVQLASNKALVAESFEDTLIDLAGYAVLYIVRLRLAKQLSPKEVKCPACHVVMPVGHLHTCPGLKQSHAS